MYYSISSLASLDSLVKLSRAFAYEPSPRGPGSAVPFAVYSAHDVTLGPLIEAFPNYFSAFTLQTPLF